MRCPYCNKNNCEPAVVRTNIRNYGGRWVRFKCNHCRKVIGVSGERRAIFGKPRQTDEDSDW